MVERDMAVKSLNDISKLLVFAPSWVGDAVMATPALRALREKFCDAEITLTGSQAALAVLEDCNLADKSVIDPGKQHGLGVLRAIRQYKAGNFDAAVMFANSVRVAAEAFFSRIPRRIGYARDLRGLLLTDRLKPEYNANGDFKVVAALDYYLQLAQLMGCDISNRSMGLGVGEEFKKQAFRLFNDHDIADTDTVIIINPGASFGASKLWLAERFAATADELSKTHNAKIIINAAPGESEIARAVGNAMNSKPAINFAELKNSLGLLKAIIAKSSLMITGDTGPRHIAAAMSCPVVTIFGSTDPDWTIIDCPYERVIITDAQCAPCQKKKCPLPLGPGHHICMKSIEVPTVLAAANELLKMEAVK